MCAVGMALSIYLIVGISGYHTFGAQVRVLGGQGGVVCARQVRDISHAKLNNQPNTNAYRNCAYQAKADILVEFPDSTAVTLCRLAIAVLVALSYPLQIMPCRQHLIHLLQTLGTPAPAPALFAVRALQPNPSAERERREREREGGRERGPGGLTRAVKGPCLQTAPDATT
jgi:hypothetical protein